MQAFPRKQHTGENELIDGLIVYEVSLEEIIDKNHGYEGKELDYSGVWDKYIVRLRNSIEKNGVGTPIVLYRAGDKYEICDGWHRWRISKDLGYKSIRAVIFDSLDDCHPTENLRW